MAMRCFARDKTSGSISATLDRMFRRSILRICCLLPCIACAFLWPVTYFRCPYVTHIDASHVCAASVVSGGIWLQSAADSSSPFGWCVGLEPAGEAYDRDPGGVHFFGFWFGQDDRAPTPIACLRIPMWFPTTCSLAAFLLIYRKTRRPNPAAAFPVQIETRKSKLEN